MNREQPVLLHCRTESAGSEATRCQLEVLQMGQHQSVGSVVIYSRVRGFQMEWVCGGQGMQMVPQFRVYKKRPPERRA